MRKNVKEQEKIGKADEMEGFNLWQTAGVKSTLHALVIRSLIEARETQLGSSSRAGSSSYSSSGGSSPYSSMCSYHSSGHGSSPSSSSALEEEFSVGKQARDSGSPGGNLLDMTAQFFSLDDVHLSHWPKLVEVHCSSVLLPHLAALKSVGEVCDHEGDTERQE